MRVIVITIYNIIPKITAKIFSAFDMNFIYQVKEIQNLLHYAILWIIYNIDDFSRYIND